MGSRIHSQMDTKEANTLENHIKLFVEHKLGEHVTLEFRNGCVIVRPCKKSGSTSIGAFWVRVLQNYFPKEEYVYQKGYNRKTGSEIIKVDVEQYQFEIHLRSGLLTLEGDEAYRYFKYTARKMMHAYDKMTGSSAADYFTDQVIADTRKEMRRSRRPLRHDDVERGEIVDPDYALISSDVRLEAEQEAYIEERLHTSLSLQETSPSRSPIPGSPRMRSLRARSPRPRSPRVRSPMAKSPSRELVLINFQEQLTPGLGTIALKDAEKYVYPIWRQTLNKWFADDRYTVHITTQAIDVDRLRDILHIGYKHRLSMRLGGLYCEPLSHHGLRMPEMKQRAITGLDNDEQLFVEYKIFNKLVLPATKRISCNFIAGVCDGMAEVLITSASFDERGIAAMNSLVSITFTKMLVEDFQKNFLDKLATV